MVRAQVAGITGFGLPCLGHGKPVPGVTGGAGSLAAVHIQPTHAHVRPGCRVQIARFIDGQFGAVAVQTADLALVVRIHALVKPWVQFPYDLNGVGVFALAVLGYFVRMASGAILGGDDRGDGYFVLFLTVGQVAAAIVFIVSFGHIIVSRLGQVAVQAGDVGVGVAAVGPIAEQTGIGLFVAFNAGHSLRWNTAFDAEFFNLGKIGLSHG